MAGLEPRFVKGGEIDFQRAGYVFEGGNTHRFADPEGLEFTARGVSTTLKNATIIITSTLILTNVEPLTISAVARTSMARW